MNRSSIVALVIAALLFGCGAGMVAHEVMESDAVAQTAWTGQKWEYTCEALWNNPLHLTEPEGIEKLRVKGEAGWELVQAGIGWSGGQNHSTSGIACFKRPLP